jgi:hypothetical protein
VTLRFATAEEQQQGIRTNGNGERLCDCTKQGSEGEYPCSTVLGPAEMANAAKIQCSIRIPDSSTTTSPMSTSSRAHAVCRG